MRQTGVVFGMLLTLAGTAHAEYYLPLQKGIPREVWVEFAQPYPEWTFFVVTANQVRQVPTTSGFFLARVAGDDDFDKRRSAGVYAVPNDLLAELGQTTPDRKWFLENWDSPRIRQSTLDETSISALITDPRVKVRQTHRLTLTPNALEAELISQEAELNWTVLIITGVVIAGVIVFGVCLIRKMGGRRTPAPPRE